MWGYRVSCVVTIVTKTRSLGIDLFTEERRVYASARQCDPVRPVGKDVWIGYIGDGFSQCQSSDAAPLTELRDLNTLLHIYSDCAARLNLIWTVCITVRISICVEEVTKCGGDLSVCQTMDGAALADDRSGVTFTAELCMPWDAPEVVIDINSTDLVSLGLFPDKVGLFGRRKDAAARRIMAGRDSRSVRFVVTDGRVVECWTWKRNMSPW